MNENVHTSLPSLGSGYYFLFLSLSVLMCNSEVAFIVSPLWTTVRILNHLNGFDFPSLPRKSLPALFKETSYIRCNGNFLCIILFGMKIGSGTVFYNMLHLLSVSKKIEIYINQAYRSNVAM